MQSRIFLQPKEKIGAIIGGFWQLGRSVWRSYLFSSLCFNFTLLGVYIDTGIK